MSWVAVRNRSRRPSQSPVSIFNTDFIHQTIVFATSPALPAAAEIEIPSIVDVQYVSMEGTLDAVYVPPTALPLRVKRRCVHVSSGISALEVCQRPAIQK